MTTTTVGELASLVRSKNAGPFWLTIDIFLPDGAAYDRVSTSPVTDVDTIASCYAVEPSSVRVFLLPELAAIKISFPRPNLQGARDDRDMHAGQQYVPLLDFPVA
jgi:hypothetical protein